MAALRSWRARVGGLSVTPAAPDALVLGTLDGQLRHPERFSRAFRSRVTSAQHSVDGPPTIRPHGRRHAYATISLRLGVHPKVVSERLGHATTASTLDIYSHAAPTLQKEAASLFAAAVFGGNAS